MISIVYEDKSGNSSLQMEPNSIVDLTQSPITFLLSPKGEVLILASDSPAVFVMKASLEDLLLAVSEMVEEAQSRWDWRSPRAGLVGTFDKNSRENLIAEIRNLIFNFKE